jgi:hypothetical protein
MRRATSSLTAAAAALCAFALVALWPLARHDGAMLMAQDDPAQLSDLRLRDAALDATAIERQIDDALAANDAGLAESFAALAAARGLSLSDTVHDRVAAAVAQQQSASYLASRFANGLVTGEADDAASLSGTVTGDLFVFGDVRDLVREGRHIAAGEEPDRLVLGLAAAGIAVTGVTYALAGSAVPVRAGLTLLKDARKAGRLGAGLSAWATRSARDLVDGERLQQAVASASVLRPGASLSAFKEVVRAEKAGGLLRAAKDVGRIGETAGTRGALDALRLSEGPQDIARAARLAEAKGGQTRALLKLFGRGALLLVAGAFDLSLWVVWAVLVLFGFVASIKATTERLTEAWLRRVKRRRSLIRLESAAPQDLPPAVQPNPAAPSQPGLAPELLAAQV